MTLALAAVVLIGVVGIILLAALHTPVPQALNSLTAGALGGLTALLVSTRVDPTQLPAERAPSTSPPPPALTTGA